MDITLDEVKIIFKPCSEWFSCDDCPCDHCRRYCPYPCETEDDRAKAILRMFEDRLKTSDLWNEVKKRFRKEQNEMPEISSEVYDQENVYQHEKVCQELSDLYARKNHDYGDSFHLSYLEEGMAMPRIRLGDKFNRFKTLTRHLDLLEKEQKVTDESVRDTLIDLANYAIMTIMEMDREAKHDPE